METKNLIPQIKLSETEQDRLKVRLDEMIQEAEEFRSSSKWAERNKEYWQMYLSKPKYAVRQTPWEGASNVYVPMTQVAVNGSLAHEFDAMLTNDPIVKVNTTRPASDAAIKTYDDDSKALSEYWAGFYRDTINLRQLGADALLDMFVDGTMAIKARMNRDTIVRREQWNTEIMGADETASKLVTVEDAFIERVDEIANDVSDLNDLYFAPGSYVSPNRQNEFAFPYTPWYYQHQELTEDALIERGRSGYDVGKAHGTDGSEIENLFAHAAEMELSKKEQAIRDKEAVSNAVLSTLPVNEFYMRWPLPATYQRRFDSETGDYKQREGDETGYAEELIVTYAPTARHLLRIVPLYRVYPDGKRPHVPGYYLKFPRFVYGQGIPSRLLNLQAATNTLTNQMIDWGSISILPHGFYNPGSMGQLPELVEMRPGGMTATPDPRGVNYPRTQFDPNAHSVWLNLINTWGQKVAGIADYQLGEKESPKTARGAIAMLQQGRLMTQILIAQHAEIFIELFRRNHALKRKYAKDVTIYRKFNESRGSFEQGKISRRAFDLETDFQFVLNPNRQEEQQLNQTLYTMFQQAIVFALQTPQVAPQIRMALGEVYESAGKKNFNQLWPQELIQVAPSPPPGMPGMPGASPVPGGMAAPSPMTGPGGPPIGQPMPPAPMPPAPMPMPMPVMMPPTPTPIEGMRPEDVTLTPAEENVRLQ